MKKMPIQNIVTPTELGRQIRKAFLPKPGTIIYNTNFSALEMRIFAEFCGEKPRV